MKSICRLFLEVLEDYKVYSAYLILNFESAFLELLKLSKSVFLKREIEFTCLQITELNFQHRQQK